MSRAGYFIVYGQEARARNIGGKIRGLIARKGDLIEFKLLYQYPHLLSLIFLWQSGHLAEPLFYLLVLSASEISRDGNCIDR